ncbi:temperature sensing protein-like protein [Wolffia australiana]
MKEEELLRCQISEWYPKFSRHSIKTLILPIPDSFLRYLLDDDGPFLLPASPGGGDPLPRHPNSADPFFSDAELDGHGGDAIADPPSFPDLEIAVQRSILALGGSVFPKLNWSSPKDAAFMAPSGSLRCSAFSDIALLLKSSDCISHDLCHALDSCSDSSPSSIRFHLALRKWRGDLRPEMEFRCFVLRRRLVGICQREVTTFYPALKEKKSEIEGVIRVFFDGVVKGDFASEDYTFDVFIAGDGRVKILDFNPWGGYTLPLMFDWDELQRMADGGFEFKIVEDRCGVRPGLKTIVPFDYLDTAPGSGWDVFLRKVDDERQRQSISSEDSE